LFPCDGVRILRNDDLRLLFAMVHKIRVSPVKAMVSHWQGASKRIGPIEFTSIITRLADTLCLLNSSVQYMRRSRPKPPTSSGHTTRERLSLDGILGTTRSLPTTTRTVRKRQAWGKISFNFLHLH
jgi:hypothetical protein